MTDRTEKLSAAPAPEGGAADDLREALIQADLKIRSLPGTDQSDVEFIRAALATREEAPAEEGEPCEHQPGCDCTVAEEDVARSKPPLRAQPQSREDAQPVAWLRAVDEEMVCAHLGVADAEDSFETAKKKLANLIQWNIAVATDPSVGGHPAPDALRVAVAALKPFAKAFRGLSSRWEDHETHWQDATSPIAVEDLRRADQALTALQAEQKGGA